MAIEVHGVGSRATSSLIAVVLPCRLRAVIASFFAAGASGCFNQPEK